MWQVIGASAQGTSHFRIGSPCQDAHGYHTLENVGCIASVADGLGTASKSDVGSSVVVESAIRNLEERLCTSLPSSVDDWKKVLLEAFANARQSLELLAQANGLPLHDYGTTLIIAAITNDWVAIAHIGDGATIALLEDDSWETISLPQNGEYANETVPITSPDAQNLVRLSVHQIKVKAVALITDGLQRLALNLATGVPFKPFFTPFFEAVVRPLNPSETSLQVLDFLNSERICAKTDDDKTIVIIGKVLGSTINV